MLIDDDLLNAAADAYLELKCQFEDMSMTFESAIRICHTRKVRYALQIELLNRFDRNYAKRRIRNGYQYGSRYLNQEIRPAVYWLGGMSICK